MYSSTDTVVWQSRPYLIKRLTIMGTTLPIITRTTGQELVIVSLFHGFVVGFSVPFLVTFFYSL